MKAANIVEIEIDGPQNQSHYFRPMQERIRGRFDAQRLLQRDDGAGRLAREWPDAIPGQRLLLDFDSGNAYLTEPLHDAEHAALRAKIEAKGFTIAERRRELPAVDVVTWAYWMASAVSAGVARIIRGEIPDKLDGEPQTQFIVKRQQDPLERLAAAVEQQNELMLRMLKGK